MALCCRSQLSNMSPRGCQEQAITVELEQKLTSQNKIGLHRSYPTSYSNTYTEYMMEFLIENLPLIRYILIYNQAVPSFLKKQTEIR